LIVNRIKGLILKVLRGEATAAEQLEVDGWLQESPENQTLFEEINDPVRVGKALAKMDAFQEEAVWDRISTGSPTLYPDDGEEGKATSSLLRPAWTIPRYLGAAAAVLLLLGLGTYLWKALSPRPAASVAQAYDVMPGTNKAILTLSNGARLILDSAKTGNLARQGNAQVVKTDSGRIAYNLSGVRPSAKLYNTLATPRGGQYQLTLPDGTKVWLNAASSIRYPVAFVGPERKVEVSGEVYFEIYKNASQPFKVSIPGKEDIEVLGTSFNVNAYQDEPEMKTTVLTGAVRVKAAASDSLVGVNTNKEKLSVVLRPGQQAQLDVGSSTKSGGRRLKVSSDADVEQTVAWKNGLFQFNGASMQTVMNQLGRWYDVEVSYEGVVPEHRFVGKVSRDYRLSEVLSILQASDIHFYIEGRQIIVKP
jgi:transmembrane sensor